MPLMVPPVPTPSTTASTRPSVSAQISGPVVAWCAAGFAGLSNWRARMPPRSAAMRSAAATAPLMPSAAGVRTSSAPKARSMARRSRLIDSGIVRTTW